MNRTSPDQRRSQREAGPTLASLNGQPSGFCLANHVLYWHAHVGARSKGDILVGYTNRRRSRPPSKPVKDVCPHDVARYTQARRSAKKGLANNSGVRRRTVYADLVSLRTMVNWATTVKVDGEWLLEENPLRGVKFPREPDPRRPVATFDRFETVRQAIQQLAAEAPTLVAPMPP